MFNGRSRYIKFDAPTRHWYSSEPEAIHVATRPMFHRHDHQGIASFAIARIRISAFFQQNFDGVLALLNMSLSNIEPLITRRREQWRAEAGLFIEVYAGSEQQFDGGWTIGDSHGQGTSPDGISRVYVGAVRDHQSRRVYTAIRQRKMQGGHSDLAAPRRRPHSIQNDPCIDVYALLK